MQRRQAGESIRIGSATSDSVGRLTTSVEPGAFERYPAPSWSGAPANHARSFSRSRRNTALVVHSVSSSRSIPEGARISSLSRTLAPTRSIATLTSFVGNAEVQTQ